MMDEPVLVPSQATPKHRTPRQSRAPGTLSPLGTPSTSSMTRTSQCSPPPGYPETPHSPATSSFPGTSSPLGTSSTSSMTRTTLPSQPLTSEQIQLPARTRPLPVLSPLHQPRRYRIGMNVVHCRSQMTLIADIAIPITSHPDAPTLQPQTQPFVMLHRPAGTVGLPALHYARQRVTAFDQDMHVVRHDAPGHQPITAAMVQEQPLAEYPGQFGSCQCAATQALIQPVLHLAAALNLLLRGWQHSQLRFNLSELGDRQGVRQAEGDELQHMRGIVMRQLVRLIPAEVLIGGWSHGRSPLCNRLQD